MPLLIQGVYSSTRAGLCPWLPAPAAVCQLTLTELLVDHWLLLTVKVELSRQLAASCRLKLLIKKNVVGELYKKLLPVHLSHAGKITFKGQHCILHFATVLCTSGIASFFRPGGFLGGFLLFFFKQWWSLYKKDNSYHDPRLPICSVLFCGRNDPLCI